MSGQIANRFRFAVFGLGNPGKEYANTRHNVGFKVVDRAAERFGAEWSHRTAAHCIYASTMRRTWRKRADSTPESVKNGDECEIYFVQPQTFMNRSGDAVRAFCQRFYVPLRNILIISDDLDLPVGKLRMRQVGRSGGQKGLESIERALDTDRFDRLKLGIGAPTGGGVAAASYVLGKIGPDDIDDIDGAIALAGEVINVWLELGAQDAMNRFNGPPDRHDPSRY
jgi:PTH1 family peptidyl-tRNA hydrolase